MISYVCVCVCVCAFSFMSFEFLCFRALLDGCVLQCCTVVKSVKQMLLIFYLMSFLLHRMRMRMFALPNIYFISKRIHTQKWYAVFWWNQNLNVVYTNCFCENVWLSSLLWSCSFTRKIYSHFSERKRENQRKWWQKWTKKYIEVTNKSQLN